MIAIEQSFALLAPNFADAESEALESDDGRFELRAQALTDGGNMQMLGINVRDGALHTFLVLDYLGRLAAFASADQAVYAEAFVAEDLRRRGVTISHRQPLLADPVAGKRRTSVLRWGAGLSVRMKLLEGEDGTSWLQLRAQMDTATVEHVHVLLAEGGALVSVVSGRTDQDAWTRVQGELNREGYAIS